MSHYSPLAAERAALMGVTYDCVDWSNPTERYEAETALEACLLERVKELEAQGHPALKAGKVLLQRLIDAGTDAWAFLDEHGYPENVPIDDDWDDEEDWREAQKW